ncbi:MAG: M28 family peptidase [Phycisphaerales bacterium JB037]
MHVRTGIVAAAGALVVVGGAWGQPAVDADQLKYWRPSAREAYRQYEDALRSIPEASSLRRYHDLTASRPHGAGTPGDDQMIETLVREFEAMGLEVERHPFWAYLSWPIDAAVEIVAGDGVDGPIALPVKERPFEGDPYADHPELRIAFNAYSGSGDVTGEVVYANYGRLEDFEKLEELGVDLTGKVVIARYGGNYRGYKAKFAEEAGAAGLLIYTDPADNGYVKGLEYPEGGWAGPEHIQRGSIKTLPYAGDPLTPGVYASEDAERLDPDEVALARIPVQPIGYGAAQQILERMRGERVPEQSWQGGLPLAYRVEGGEALRVRVMVEQERRITKLHNVVATLRGSEFPEQKIVLGSHHDSWGFGAGDSTSGLICLLETARAFAEMAERGQPPKRTLVFAGWGAEEHGIIGSTEWVEHHAEDLSENAIAYINMDMSAMGPNFGSSAAPSLKRIIVESSKAVPQAREPGMSVYEHWHGRGKDADFPDEPRIGDLGGGSDHIAFWCHLAIPSLSLGGGGSDGVSYHGVADNLHWYRQVVGEDYEPALMVTRMAVTVASRLANAELLPLDPARYGPEFRKHLRAIARDGVASRMWTRIEPDTGLPLELMQLDVMARQVGQDWSTGRDLALRAVADTTIAESERSEIIAGVNREIRDAEYGWTMIDGLVGRPWFGNLFAAPDENSGYSAWMLPELRAYQRDPNRFGQLNGDLPFVGQHYVRDAYINALHRAGSGGASIRWWLD